jgi:hypothetical protein
MKSTVALLLRVLVLATTTTTCRGDEGEHDKPEVTKITAQLEKPVSDFTATYFDGPIEGFSAPKDEQSERSIVLIGGCSDPLGNVYNEIFEFFTCSQFTSEVNVFYPDTETFGKLPDLPEPRSRHTAIAEGRKIYVIGGRSETDALIKNVIVSVIIMFVFRKHYEACIAFNSATLCLRIPHSQSNYLYTCFCTKHRN